MRGMRPGGGPPRQAPPHRRHPRQGVVQHHHVLCAPIAVNRLQGATRPPRIAGSRTRGREVAPYRPDSALVAGRPGQSPPTASPERELAQTTVPPLVTTEGGSRCHSQFRALLDRHDYQPILACFADWIGRMQRAKWLQAVPTLRCSLPDHPRWLTVLQLRAGPL